MAFPVLLLAPVVVLVVLVLSRVRVPDRDVAWLSGRPWTPPDEAAVYARYLRRHRVHRLLGGLTGAAVAAIVGVRWYGTVRAGIGEISPLADVLFGALAGIVVGSLSAETFRLAEPRRRVTSASLEPRAVPAGTGLVAGARLLTVLAVGVGAAVLATGHGATPLATAVPGVLVVLLAEVARGAVRGRRRPALSARAARVDRRIRAFAGRSVAYLEAAAAVLTAGWVLSGMPVPTGGAAAALGAVGVLGCLVVALVLLHRAAPRASARRPVVA